MSDTFELATYNRDNLYLDMHWLYENQLRYERNHPERALPKPEEKAGEVE
jgi:NADH-quinone oxidoreductase subunit I